MNILGINTQLSRFFYDIVLKRRSFSSTMLLTVMYDDMILQF